MSLKKDFMSRKIDCPKCGVGMNRREVAVFGPNIDIDVCPKCEGLWLDKGEIKKLIKNKKLTDYLTKDIGTQSKSKLICPRCGGLMDIETADEVEVDVCLTCNGVWLDKGELQDLEAKSKTRFKGDDTDKAVERWEEHVKRSRRGSFLSRIFGR
jgi:Zn-finger nucleic acid-binding protein